MHLFTYLSLQLFTSLVNIFILQLFILHFLYASYVRGMFTVYCETIE